MTKIKCTECREEFDQSENINISYDKAGNHDHCSIDCVLQHVALEIFSDDRPMRDLVNIIAKAQRIHNENI